MEEFAATNPAHSQIYSATGLTLQPLFSRYPARVYIKQHGLKFRLQNFSTFYSRRPCGCKFVYKFYMFSRLLRQTFAPSTDNEANVTDFPALFRAGACAWGKCRAFSRLLQCGRGPHYKGGEKERKTGKQYNFLVL